MGFHELEHDPDGQPFRWTGPDPRFSFEFFINRTTPARFVLRFGPLFTGGSPIGLLCFVDGEPAPVKLQAATTCFEAVGVLPPRRDAGGSVLSFVCPQMGSPASQGLDDARMLGLLFRRLTVESTPEQQALAPAAPRLETVAPAADVRASPAPRGEFAAKKPVVKTASERAASAHVPGNFVQGAGAMSAPEIALCICTYDRYDLLPGAIRSALEQSLAGGALRSHRHRQFARRQAGGAVRQKDS